jgi:hypothetical protein
MRRAIALAALPLAACAGTAATGTPIECRVQGSDRFAPVCSLETAERSDGLVLTVRKPDGGFRRLLLANDDRGLIAADGSEPAEFALIGDGRIEVSLGGDRFRLPAAAPSR